MKVFQVGGSVRDELLGLPVEDRDYVVVGASPEEMLEAGFKPVGNHFPVFLHPVTHEEYALARTERKVGKGYGGFTFFTGKEVTLEEDLLRRDFTVNAIAKDSEGNLIDPYGGIQDLESRIFRHVSASFSEDPLRVIRLGRFLARFPDFSVSMETLQLVQQLVESGELAHLTLERLWKEWKRGLILDQPDKMVSFLDSIGALSVSLGIDSKVCSIDALIMTLRFSAASKFPLEVRWLGLLFQDDPQSPIGQSRMTVPNEIKQLGSLFSSTYRLALKLLENGPYYLQRLLRRLDRCRRPERYERWVALFQAYEVYQSSGMETDIVLSLIEKASARICQIDRKVFEGLSSQEIMEKRESMEVGICADVLNDMKQQNGFT